MKKEYRKAAGVKAQYFSLEELREAYHCKPVGKRRTKDETKLQAQRDNFRGYHKCKACGQPMVYIGNGVHAAMVCKNENCKGIAVERPGKDGSTIITYEVSCEVLDDKYTEIADNLFD